MPRNQPILIPPDSADVGLAFITADALRAKAQPFIDSIGTDISLAGQRGAEGMGELVASATNMVLSIEIYLKALLWHHKLAAPKVHDLPTLFNTLPSHLQKKVEESYERLRQSEPLGTAELAIHVAKVGDRTPEFKRTGPAKSLKVGALLKRNADAFVTWRYLFAHPVTKNLPPLIYEFRRLGFVAAAVREQLAIGQVVVVYGGA